MNRTIEERNKLVEDNMGLVWSVANKMRQMCVFHNMGTFDDIVSVGTLGLISAASKYDPARGNDLSAFSTYAYISIRNAIYTAAKHGGVVYVPTIIKCKMSEREYEENLKYAQKAYKCRGFECLPRTNFDGVSDSDGSVESRFDVDFANSRPQPDLDVILDVRKGISRLYKEDAQLLYWRFWGNKTYEEIGKLLGTTKQRAIARTKHVMSKLKRQLSAYS